MRRERDRESREIVDMVEIVPAGVIILTSDIADEARQERPESHTPGHDSSPVDAIGVPVHRRGVSDVQVSEMQASLMDDEIIGKQ